MRQSDPDASSWEKIKVGLFLMVVLFRVWLFALCLVLVLVGVWGWLGGLVVLKLLGVSLFSVGVGWFVYAVSGTRGR